MPLADVRAAYASRAAEYVDLFGSIDAAAHEDREHVLAWAGGLGGAVIDVGCGPGQWTHFLHQHGIDIEGVDPVPAFVEVARGHHPEVTYRTGRAERLDVEEASLGGILAWFSLLHTDPARIDLALAEFARCTRAGGGLLVGFFEGPSLAPFDHAVTTAWFWPIDLLCAHIERAGFTVIDARTRTDPGVRRQGMITARRRTARG